MLILVQEIQNAYHTNALLVKILLSQAQAQGLELLVDTNQLENEFLLKQVCRHEMRLPTTGLGTLRPTAAALSCMAMWCAVHASTNQPLALVRALSRIVCAHANYRDHGRQAIVQLPPPLLHHPMHMATYPVHWHPAGEHADAAALSIALLDLLRTDQQQREHSPVSASLGLCAPQHQPREDRHRRHGEYTGAPRLYRASSVMPVHRRHACTSASCLHIGVMPCAHALAAYMAEDAHVRAAECPLGCMQQVRSLYCPDVSSAPRHALAGLPDGCLCGSVMTNARVASSLGLLARLCVRPHMPA